MLEAERSWEFLDAAADIDNHAYRCECYIDERFVLSNASFEATFNGRTIEMRFVLRFFFFSDKNRGEGTRGSFVD